MGLGSVLELGLGLRLRVEVRAEVRLRARLTFSAWPCSVCATTAGASAWP